MATSVASVLLALAALPLTSADTGASIFEKRQSTCSSSVESCSTGVASTSTCCVNRPGGLFLQVQFWDTNPVEGPSNSWGIHGLWPDNCDGTYSSSCDTSRDYTDMTTLIEEFGTTQLLDDMNTYWNSNDETNEAFWEHEWASHGTCVTTLDPSCYTNYQTGMEAVDFFQITVNLFKTLDTYQILSDAGIVPSNSATYTSKEILAALSASAGADPVLLCSSSTLSSIYYGFYVTGPLLNEDFTPTTVTGEDSTCPSSGISYPVKSGATTTVALTTATSTAKVTTTKTSSTAVTTTTASSSTAATSTSSCKVAKLCATSTTTSATSTTSSASSATGSSVSGSGYWYAYYSGSEDGCLISYGTWYTTGTCATYTATASGSGFTMTSSKGSCGIVSGTLSCGSSVSASTFTVINGYLAYDGSTAFYASEVPTGTTQADISADSGSYSVTFEWTST